MQNFIHTFFRCGHQQCVRCKIGVYGIRIKPIYANGRTTLMHTKISGLAQTAHTLCRRQSCEISNNQARVPKTTSPTTQRRNGDADAHDDVRFCIRVCAWCSWWIRDGCFVADGMAIAHNIVDASTKACAYIIMCMHTFTHPNVIESGGVFQSDWRMCV